MDDQSSTVMHMLIYGELKKDQRRTEEKNCSDPRTDRNGKLERAETKTLEIAADGGAAEGRYRCQRDRVIR